MAKIRWQFLFNYCRFKSEKKKACPNVYENVSSKFISQLNLRLFLTRYTRVSQQVISFLLLIKAGLEISKACQNEHKRQRIPYFFLNIASFSSRSGCKVCVKDKCLLLFNKRKFNSRNPQTEQNKHKRHWILNLFLNFLLSPRLGTNVTSVPL